MRLRHCRSTICERPAGTCLSDSSQLSGRRLQTSSALRSVCQPGFVLKPKWRCIFLRCRTGTSPPLISTFPWSSRASATPTFIAVLQWQTTVRESAATTGDAVVDSPKPLRAAGIGDVVTAGAVGHTTDANDSGGGGQELSILNSWGHPDSELLPLLAVAASAFVT